MYRVYVFCACSVFGHRRAGSHGNPFINTGNQGNILPHHAPGEPIQNNVTFVAGDFWVSSASYFVLMKVRHQMWGSLNLAVCF